MIKKIYIAGKVSGLPVAQTSMKFGKHQQLLMQQGHTPIVPLDICTKKDTWHQAMRKCIAALVTCDEIHMLHDWQDSPGATLEHELAGKLGITIHYINNSKNKTHAKTTN